MPEYLAPDVYVEEVDTGSKPIEGVSTSTAGMLGVSERGPANVPILVTSYGEFSRWFGDELDPALFVNPADPNDLHCFLPHGVDGFFTNGGKRLYVTRVEAAAAARAEFSLHDRGSASSATTWLLRLAPELTGNTPADALYVVNVSAVAPSTGALAPSDHIRIGGGSDAEYRDVNGGLFAAPNHLSLAFPLARAHVNGVANVFEIVRVLGVAPNTFALALAAAAGASVIEVAAAAGDIIVDDLLEIGAGAGPVQRFAEHRFVRNVAPGGVGNLRLTLDSPLQRVHAAAAAPYVTKLNPAPGGANEIANTTLEANRDAAPGDRVVFLAAPGANFVDRVHLIVFDRGTNATREARRVGRLSVLGLAHAAYENYAAGTVVERVTIAADAAVVPNPKTLASDAIAGTNVLALGDRVGVAAGTVLQIGAAAPFEFATVVDVPNRSPGGAGPDAGILVLSYGLHGDYPSGTPITALTAPGFDVSRSAAVAVLATAPGRVQLVISDGGDSAAVPPDQLLAGEVVRLTVPGVGTFYHGLAANAALADARPVQVTVPVAQAHAAGAPVAERVALIRVQALDTGGWGNRLRLSVADEETGLVSRTPVIAAIAQNRIRLASAAGVEAGTILELRNGAAGPLLATVKVMTVDRATAEVTLDAAAQLTAPQVASINGAPPSTFVARSREFNIIVRVRAAADPSNPTSAETISDFETFRWLSMDPRHSRYLVTVLGRIGGPPRLSDRRPDGESWYVRVDDIAPSNVIRLGPEPLSDVLADGRREPARHPLAGGNDSMATMNDNVYIGADNANPENRTGLFSLRNIEDISIVAVPGRTSAGIQNAVINHCELARFRFAVLDARRAPHDAIADVINQRQQYDTKYAALYHPWLLIPPPFPTSPAQPDEYSIPPSGHVVGVYARTDIERGVHKAPANEVVRGVVGLQRLLNKGEHDILNPYPININVIRDFRPNSRGIRVFGGRVITSDSDWKYVNVRRLLIFIEASINRGLQWVVFEPNAEPLWARVRRSISNFLTLVWRNGALEGTKVEEAYFVKCDRTTMTQTDIDSGRLICLVGVAPVKPAEFVIIRIGLWTAHADD
jgi:Bacteriophage tail sheath protein